MGIAWSLPPHQVLPSTVYKILGLYYWQCGLLKTSWIIWFIENGFASTTWDCLGQQDAFGGRLLSYFKYASVQAEVIISRWWQVNGVLCWTLRYCRYCFPWIKNKTDQSQDFQNSLVGGNSSRQNFEVFTVLKTSLDFLLATKKILLLVPSRNIFLLRNYFIDYVSFPTFLLILIVIIFL